MKQWQLFSSEFLSQHGYPADFFPFNREWLQQFEIVSSHAGKLAEGRTLCYIGCKQARTHIDGSLNLPFVSILVLRNDGLIAKASRYGKQNWEPQVAGTVVLLNIHKLHHCIKDQRLPAVREGYWIGLLAEYAKKPSREKVNKVYEDFMRERCRRENLFLS